MKKAPFSKEVANPRGSQAAPIAPQAPIIPLDFTEQALARLTANSDSTEANPNTQAPNDSRTIEQVSRDAALYSQYLLEFDKALAAKDSAKANELLHLLVDNADHGSLFDRHALRVKLRKLMEK